MNILLDKWILMYYFWGMAMILIKDFAELHDVDTSAVRHAIKAGNLKAKKKYGLYVLSDKQKYTPHTRGRKSNRKK